MSLPFRSVVLLSLGLPFLAGCGAVGGSGVSSSATRPPPPMAAQFSRGQPLVGLDAKALIDRFGTPRLDIRDRSVRKLQFSVGSCVLDAYLYSVAKGREPVVAHIDTRQTDGRDVDPARCGIR